MSNTTENRGYGERPTKAQMDAILTRVEDMVIRQGLNTHEVAEELGMPHSTAHRYYKKVKEKYSGLLTEEDRRQFIEKSVGQHESMLKEGLLLIQMSKTIVEPDKRASAIAKGIDTVNKAQAGYEAFADKFLKFAGDTLKGANITFNIQNIVATPQWEEFMDYLIQWLESKGLDPAQLAEFIEDMQAGIIKPVHKKPHTIELSRSLEKGTLERIGADEYIVEAQELQAEYEELEGGESNGSPPVSDSIT